MNIYLRKEKTSKTDKDGTVKDYINFYLLTEDGNRVYIKPAFQSGYGRLDVLATYIQKPGE